MTTLPYDIVFFEDEEGEKPCLKWIKDGLSPVKRRAIGYAMANVLQKQGKDVCNSHWGRDLGAIFEFRLDDEEGGEDILLRVFCHLYGDKRILALGGYDKGADPGKRRQSAELALATKRLDWWKAQRAKERRAARKTGQSSGGAPRPAKRPKKAGRKRR